MIRPPCKLFSGSQAAALGQADAAEWSETKRPFNCLSMRMSMTLPDGAISAIGTRGHKVLVIPRWDLAIVHRANTLEAEGGVTATEFGQRLKRILAAWPRGVSFNWRY
ncbi:MAG: hypothetical protein H8E20_11875 [Verrucomicrobia bacterium]|nr:hypothetical protein [Verrucomicrobiota bacterium]